jgi:hypothetical protein
MCTLHFKKTLLAERALRLAQTNPKGSRLFENMALLPVILSQRNHTQK